MGPTSVRDSSLTLFDLDLRFFLFVFFDHLPYLLRPLVSALINVIIVPFASIRSHINVFIPFRYLSWGLLSHEQMRTRKDTDKLEIGCIWELVNSWHTCGWREIARRTYTHKPVYGGETVLFTDAYSAHRIIDLG